MLLDSKLIIQKLISQGWSDIGCGSDEEPKSTKWCKSLEKGITDKKEYNIIDWGCGYGRFLTYIIRNNMNNFKYYGFELRGNTHGDLLIDFCKENFSHLDTNEEYS